MFAELHCKSHFSFLTGASSPQELVFQAAHLGYSAVSITDECSLAGVVKAHEASKECGIKLIIGSEFLIDDLDQNLPAIKLVLLAPSRTAYAEISALITKGRRRSKKGEYQLSLDDLRFGLQHVLAIYIPPRLSKQSNIQQAYEQAQKLKGLFKDRLWFGVELFWLGDDQAHYLECEHIARQVKINMLACNDVHVHDKSRQALQDVITAIRVGVPINELGSARFQNSERYLKPLTVLQHQYPQALLDEALAVADLCHFSLDELRYEYPQELVPSEVTPAQYLRQLCDEGANIRYPNGAPDKVQKQIAYELNLINELNYEYYFLTVYDIVKFARTQNILCQGRGSAANSAVCYCLHITEVDPANSSLLFERFISKERDEPPDIDVDFENARREEVIQYIYNKYSRKRTALVATVITYRRKSAVREVGKALGLPKVVIDELSGSMAWWDSLDTLQQHMAERDMLQAGQITQYYFDLVQQIMGAPRHLSQHVGGFLITQSPVSTLVPIENAAMPDRTIIQWDKDDIEALGMLKIDVLALGMLSAIQKCFGMINQYLPKHLPPLCLASIPKEDPAVYNMLCKGDSIGVFQVESRAQMSMLPRLRPRCFYDLVIEVAIVRPGPIQGDMVHPYLKRRNGEEPITYPNKQIKAVLERTLGVPIFQEQVIKLTMVAAGFSGGEADQLRRAMASWGKNGKLHQFRDKLINGMLKNGYDLDFAERLFKQILGFGAYGFPESHSASFALLVYFSSWLKRHHPAAFYCAILNSQPMGFYTPSQLVQDARRHNIEVLPVCVNQSQVEHSLVVDQHTLAQNPSKSSPFANYTKGISIRLGLCLVKGLNLGGAQALVKERHNASYRNIADLKQRLLKPKLISQGDLQALMQANAMHCFNLHRRSAHWQALELVNPFNDAGESSNEANLAFLKAPSPVQDMHTDYQSMGLSLQHHPLALLRKQTPFNKCCLANGLINKRNKGLIEVAGVVTGRQRPGSASGVIFMTLEDETGNINVVLWNSVQARFKQEILTGRLLYIKGQIEHSEGVANVIAGYIEDHSMALPALEAKSRDFH